MKTLFNLGLWKTIKIGCHYIVTRLSRQDKIETLEDLYIHRFGKELYRTFFKGYTEKIWGVPCNAIQPEWGLQRIKNLSISKTVFHALKNSLIPFSSTNPTSVETSLIKTFTYPKLGSGQMWDEVAKSIQKRGGDIHLNQKVTKLHCTDRRITQVEVTDPNSGEKTTYKGDYFISTMPMKELILSLDTPIPDEVSKIARGLLYRDFIIVGILLKKLKIQNNTKTKALNDILPDHWIYIQDENIKIGRLQIMNNWSPYCLKNMDTVWIGAEYFCSKGDELWNMTEGSMKDYAIRNCRR